ncbi:spermidine/putrescine ABC transporter substrate-binding protein [Leucobacter sp. CSA1]|uniref:Spermidine/putrescine ABC transporter substrate-binding protein n=1 Tax=Leucobacter chromiisoli TaxID=2796471 RepID=A0A934QAA3_9MICO|nr:spermidine/putrescine ABC transporter substrate-binding protein [Leucobacter chromiisoli]MBK0420418.1 spermidine/putrescine ABC transporter substrate-binding protein [Leucobacter chromiisoli]
MNRTTHRLGQARLSRRGFLLGGAGAAGLLLGGCASGDGGGGSLDDAEMVSKAEIDGDLNLFSYAEYFSPDVLAGFEEHYGVKINYTYFSTTDEAMAKLSADQPIDLTTLPSERMLPLAESGLLKRIDHDAIEHYGEVLPAFVVPPYNGSDEEANERTAPFVAAPYATGSVGIAWRDDRVRGMTGSFDDLWNQPDAAGRTFLWDAMQPTISIILRRLGYDPAEAAEQEMEEALGALEELRPSLGGFSGVDTTNIENGQAWLTPVYAGDLYSALNAMPEDQRELWQFQTNEESALFNADNYAIPAASEHSGTALCFVDWMLQPENMRTNVEYVGYPIPTTTGMEAYAELTAAYPWLQIDEGVFADTDQWLTPISDDRLRLWQRTWNTMKAG